MTSHILTPFRAILAFFARRRMLALALIGRIDE